MTWKSVILPLLVLQLAWVPAIAEEKVFTKELEARLDTSLAKRRPENKPEVSEARFILIYFSALWCGACDNVEARLKALYRNEEYAPHFEVVMVSHDFDKPRWKEHASKVPWPTVHYEVEHHEHEDAFFTRLGRRALPGLILCSQDGIVLAETYVNQKWVGPDHVLTELRKRIKELRRRGDTSDSY